MSGPAAIVVHRHSLEPQPVVLLILYYCMAINKSKNQVDAPDCFRVYLPLTVS